jgi:hypothetical protein
MILCLSGRGGEKEGAGAGEYATEDDAAVYERSQQVMQYTLSQYTLSQYTLSQYTLSQYTLLQYTLSQYTLSQYTLAQYTLSQYTLSQYALTTFSPHSTFSIGGMIGLGGGNGSKV